MLKYKSEIVQCFCETHFTILPSKRSSKNKIKFTSKIEFEKFQMFKVGLHPNQNVHVKRVKFQNDHCVFICVYVRACLFTIYLSISIHPQFYVKIGQHVI